MISDMISWALNIETEAMNIAAYNTHWASVRATTLIAIEG